MAITVKNCTFAVDVQCVSGTTNESSQHSPDGLQPGTRKNPHVIDVGLGQGITLN